LTCHNDWIVIRLVSGDRPFIAFSPLITMNDSSVPFRAFLGAILSIVKGEVVEASAFDDGQTLDTINEGAPGPSGSNSDPDSDNGSGGYQDRLPKGQVVRHRPITRTLARKGDATLTVRPSCAPFISMGRLKFISIDFVIFSTVS
jgi:hypothetical protein